MPLTISASVPENPSPLVKLALEFADGLTNANNAKIANSIVENYHHIFLPGNPVPPSESKEAYLKHLGGVFPVFGEIDANLKELVVSEETLTVVAHASAKGTFSFGEAYDNDNVLILHAAKQPDGSLKFVDGKEFVNTKMGEKLREKLAELSKSV